MTTVDIAVSSRLDTTAYTLANSPHAVRVNFPAAAGGRTAGIAALWWRLVAPSQRQNATFDSSPEPQRRSYSINVTLRILKHLPFALFI